MVVIEFDGFNMIELDAPIPRIWELYIIHHGPHICFSAMCWGYNVWIFDQQTLGM